MAKSDNRVRRKNGAYELGPDPNQPRTPAEIAVSRARVGYGEPSERRPFAPVEGAVDAALQNRESRMMQRQAAARGDDPAEAQRQFDQGRIEAGGAAVVGAARAVASGVPAVLGVVSGEPAPGARPSQSRQPSQQARPAAPPTVDELGSLRNRARELAARLRDPNFTPEQKSTIQTELRDVRDLGANLTQQQRRERSVERFGGEEARAAAMRAEGDRILSPENIAGAIEQGRQSEAQIQASRDEAARARAASLAEQQRSDRARSLGVDSAGLADLERLNADVTVRPDLTGVRAGQAEFARASQADQLARRIETDPALRSAVGERDLANAPLNEIESMATALAQAEQSRRVDPEIAAAQARAAGALAAREAEAPVDTAVRDAQASDRVAGLRSRVEEGQQRERDFIAQQERARQAAFAGALDPEQQAAISENAVQTAGALGELGNIRSLNDRTLAQTDSALSAIEASLGSNLTPQAAGAMLAAMGMTSATAPARLGESKNEAQEAVRLRVLDIVRRLEEVAGG